MRFVAKRTDDAIDIAFEHGGEIGIDHRSIAATDQLDERPDPVACRNLRKADLAREIGKRGLMLLSLIHI